jgi:hypothetical protein
LRICAPPPGLTIREIAKLSVRRAEPDRPISFTVTCAAGLPAGFSTTPATRCTGTLFNRISIPETFWPVRTGIRTACADSVADG